MSDAGEAPAQLPQPLNNEAAAEVSSGDLQADEDSQPENAVQSVPPPEDSPARKEEQEQEQLLENDEQKQQPAPEDEEGSQQQQQQPPPPAPAAVPAPSLAKARAEAEYWRRIEAEHDRLDRHAERVNVVAHEVQRVLALSEQEKLHWRKQYDRIRAMERRMQTACRTAARLHRSLEQTTQLIQDLSSQLIEGLDDDSDGFNLSKDPSSRAKKRKPKPAAAKKSLAAIGGVGSGLGDPPEADEVQETGTLRQACIAQEILQRTTSQYLEEMLGRVFRSAGEQARELLAHTRARAAEQQKLTSAVFQEQMRARDSAAAAWRQYMKASEERQRLTLMNTPLQEDPYLACRDYARAMAQLGSMDTQYRQTMAETLMQLKVDDGRRISALQAIMLDVLLGQRSVLEHALKFTNSTIATVKAIDRDADVAEFLEMADLVHPAEQAQAQGLRHLPGSSPSAAAGGGGRPNRGAASGAAVGVQGGKKHPAAAAAPSSSSVSPASAAAPKLGPASAGLQGMTVFEARPPQLDYGVVSRLYSQEVDHEGVLGRPGRSLLAMVGGNGRWKDVRAVVSSSGFLHYFEAGDYQGQERPSFSLALHECVIRRSGAGGDAAAGSAAASGDPLVFEVEAPNKSWMSLSGAPVVHPFRAGSAEELATWVAVLGRHCMQPLVSPGQAQARAQAQPQADDDRK